MRPVATKLHRSFNPGARIVSRIEENQELKAIQHALTHSNTYILILGVAWFRYSEQFECGPTDIVRKVRRFAHFKYRSREYHVRNLETRITFLCTLTYGFKRGPLDWR